MPPITARITTLAVASSHLTPALLDRPLSRQAQPDRYCAGVGHGRQRGAVYVENWVRVLEEDPREIHRAAAEAQRMSCYLIGRVPRRLR